MARVGRTLPVIRALRRLPAAQKGVAAVEFALLIPILLVLYLGAVDVSQGLSADRKLASAVSSVSDLVSRNKDSVSIDDVHAYFAAAEAIMRPFNGPDVKLRLTIVDVDGNVTTVADTEPWNGAETASVGASFDLPSEMMTLADGRSVIVAEGWFPYEPVTGYKMSEIGLYKRSMHMLRFDSDDFHIVRDGTSSAPPPEPEPEPEPIDPPWWCPWWPHHSSCAS